MKKKLPEEFFESPKDSEKIKILLNLMEPHKEDPFSPDLVVKCCSEAAQNLEDIPIEPFCLAMNEYTKLLKLLGSAMSLAFSDITSKTAALMGHIKTYGSKINGLMSLIQLELRLGVQNLSGENNHKLTKNKDLLKYESGEVFLIKRVECIGISIKELEPL